MKQTQAPTRLTHRVAFFILGCVLAGIIASLPIAFAGVMADVAETSNPTYFIFGDHQHEGADRMMLNLSMTGLDEWQRTITMQVSGHRVCATACSGTDRVQFMSIPVAAEDGEGLPPYAIVSFGPGVRSVTDQLHLPVAGHAIRYPFDRSALRLGVVIQRSNPDGSFQTVSPAQAPEYLFLSVNGSIPRAVMQRPEAIPLDTVRVEDPAWRFAGVWQLFFTRPLYLQVVAIVLLLLVSLAAVYAVVMSPLRDLVISSGALILGVWGIRAIVLGANLSGFTVIDLSLMLVILFLLVAITWRTLQYLHDRGELAMPLFRRTAPAGEPGDQPDSAAARRSADLGSSSDRAAP